MRAVAVFVTSSVLSVWAASGLANPPPVQTIGGVSMPGVPPVVAQDAVAATAAARDEVSQAETEESLEATANVALTVVPGTTELVRVARNHLNHVITPFPDPKLLTASSVEVRKEGSSLYIATASEQPVGVHIRANDPSDTRSISLTLIPARIPPRTITLRWPEGASVPLPLSSSKAKRWEESAPYEGKLLELVEAVARGNIPDGYALSETPDQIQCALPDVTFEAGQRLTGSHFSVFVLRAVNHGSSGVELLSHAGCNFPGVVLVAPWPRAYLESGAETEVYVTVANERFQPEVRSQFRPSLLKR